jgi:hypothetical protein
MGWRWVTFSGSCCGWPGCGEVVFERDETRGSKRTGWIPAKSVITHRVPARMPPEKAIQAEVLVYGTIAVETSKREVRSVLQGV